MFRLIKLCFGMAAFVAIAWFGTTVKLGQLTLFQHLRAIGQTQESRELIDGTREAAEPLFNGVRRQIAGKVLTPAVAGPDGGAPEEKLSPADKKQLRKFLADHR
jgi:hypothetical protein